MASDDFQGKNAPHEDNISDLNLENSSQGASGKPSFTNQLQYISKMVIKQTMSHKFAGPFLKPVNGKIYTDYYPMITKPMDLGTIKKRLNERWYSSASQCIADFKQMFENCRAYNINKDDPVILQMNDSLEAFVLEKTSKMPPMEEPVQPVVKSKGSVKKGKMPSKVVSEELNGHQSPPTDPSQNLILPPIASHPAMQEPPQVSLESKDSKPLKATEVKKSLKRKVDDSSVVEQPVKRERNVKKVKYNEADDVNQPELSQQPPLPLSNSLAHCKKILHDMFQPPSLSRATFFYRPFDTSLPQYYNFYQVVKRPIDLSFIESKFQTKAYQSSKEFADDMRLMFSNCYRFFPPDTDIVHAARYLQDIFELNFARIPESPSRYNKPPRGTRRSRMDEEDDDDDDDDDEEYFSKLDKLRESLEKLQSELVRMTEEGRLSRENKQRKRRLRQQQQQQQHSQQQQQYLQQHQHLYTTPHHNNQHPNKGTDRSNPHQSNPAESQTPTNDSDVKNLQYANFNNNNNNNFKNQSLEQQNYFAASQHLPVTNNQLSSTNANNSMSSNNNDNHYKANTTATPPMPSASNSDITFDEIKKLSDDIQNVPAKELLNMWMMLRSMESCLKDSNPDEIELDFSAFKPSTLRWLQAYVKPYQSHTHQHHSGRGGHGGGSGGRGGGSGGRGGGSGGSGNHGGSSGGGGHGSGGGEVDGTSSVQGTTSSGGRSGGGVNAGGGGGGGDTVDGRGGTDGGVEAKNMREHNMEFFKVQSGGMPPNVADSKQQNVAFLPQNYPQQPHLPPQQSFSPQQNFNQFQNASNFQHQQSQPPLPNQLFPPGPFMPTDHKHPQQYIPQNEFFNKSDNNQHLIQQQQQQQQVDDNSRHRSNFQNSQEIPTNNKSQQPHNDYQQQQLQNFNNNASNIDNNSTFPQQQQQSYIDQSNTNNQRIATSHGTDSINKLLRNITEVSSASNSPQPASRPPTNLVPSTAPVSSVITNLIGSNGNKSSPFNQSEGSNTPGSTSNNKSNKEGGRLKSLGSWSSLAQMSKNADAVNISKKNSEQSFNLFKKQAEEKKERERQNREQEEQRRHRLEQFQHEKMKKEQEKQRAKEEEEALAGMLDAASHQASETKSTLDSPSNGSDDSDARTLSQKEKNRLREQERRKRAARAGLIDMNAQSVLMADFEKDLKNS